MTVAPAGEKLVGELQTIGGTMTADWLKEAGAEGQAIVDAFNTAK
jgi:hypothetical protein